MRRHLKKHDIHINPCGSDTESEEGLDPIKYTLLMFLITAALHFRCVENEYFKKFCNLLNKDFNIPTRREISDLASVYYDSKVVKLRNELSSAKSISLTTDTWTSCQNYSYISLTAHFFNTSGTYVSYCLGIKHFLLRHTTTNIVSNLNEIINLFGINDIVHHIVTDNAPNISNAVLQMGKKHVRCIAHILHLIVVGTFKLIKEYATDENATTQEFSIVASLNKSDEERVSSYVAYIQSKIEDILSKHRPLFMLLNNGNIV